MWHLYISMSMLAAAIVLKLVHPLIGKGRLRHSDAVTDSDRRFLYVLVGALPLLSLGIYLVLGSPELKGSPATLLQYRDLPNRHLSLLALQPFETLVKKDPHNIGALVSLARINHRLRNYADSISFYRQAVEEARLQNDISLRILANVLGEVQVEANGGMVGDDAVETFRYVLVLHPDNPIARYYLALRKAQDGHYAEAIEEWSALLEGGNPEIYWKKWVRERIAEAKKKLSQDRTLGD